MVHSFRCFTAAAITRFENAIPFDLRADLATTAPALPGTPSESSVSIAVATLSTPENSSRVVTVTTWPFSACRLPPYRVVPIQSHESHLTLICLDMSPTLADRIRAGKLTPVPCSPDSGNNLAPGVVPSAPGTVGNSWPRKHKTAGQRHKNCSRSSGHSLGTGAPPELFPFPPLYSGNSSGTRPSQRPLGRLQEALMCEDCTRYREVRRRPREPRSTHAGDGELLYRAKRVELKAKTTRKERRE